MANQLFLLLWLLPSLMIGLPGVFSSPTIAFHRVQYDRPKKGDHLFKDPPEPDDILHFLKYIDDCYFGITGPDSDCNAPRISLYACVGRDDDHRNSRLDKCEGTILIRVKQSGDKAMLECHYRGSYSPRYMVVLPASLYDVAQFGPSILKDERMFTTVISSSILGGNEKPGVPIKFMMETDGEVLLQIGGVEPNREKAIRIENLIFEPRRADRDRTTLAFVYPNGEIAFSPSFLKGDGRELKPKPHFAMFFSNNDTNDGHVIGKGGDIGCDLACSLNRYKSSYQPMSDFTLSEDLFYNMKQCVTTCPTHSLPSLRSNRSSSDRSSRSSSDRSSRSSSDRSSRRSSSDDTLNFRGFESKNCNIL